MRFFGQYVYLQITQVQEMKLKDGCNKLLSVFLLWDEGWTSFLFPESYLLGLAVKLTIRDNYFMGKKLGNPSHFQKLN